MICTFANKNKGNAAIQPVDMSFLSSASGDSHSPRAVTNHEPPFLLFSLSLFHPYPLESSYEPSSSPRRPPLPSSLSPALSLPQAVAANLEPMLQLPNPLPEPFRKSCQSSSLSPTTAKRTTAGTGCCKLGTPMVFTGPCSSKNNTSTMRQRGNPLS